MIPSTMSRKSKIISSIGFFILLFVVWKLLALHVDISFVIPHPIPTFKKLFALLISSESINPNLHFWNIVGASLLRIFLGLCAGILVGLLLAFLAIRFPFLQGGIQAYVGIIKATPVASFILILWCMTNREFVPVAIATLMVCPIIYQNLFSGYFDLEKEKRELLDVFKVPFLTKLKIFILPELLKYLFPAIISATGLAWKSGIAAEIIAYTKNSIGREISNAKNILEGELLFAFTIVVILISLVFEYGLKFLERRFMHGRISKRI